MKTAVITYCLGYNYGAMMQTYATIKAIEELGHEVQLVNYHHPWSFGPNPWDLRNYLGRTPRSIIGRISAMIKLRTLRKQFSPMWALWPLTEYYGTDGNKIIANPPKCDCLITGSDQTWNTSTARHIFAPYFLDFGSEDVKRISYAPSLGNIKFREADKDWLIDHLNRYSSISVREKGDVTYLTSLGIKDVVQMPDPTMIVPRTVYDDFIVGETHHIYDAVVYMLGEKNPHNEHVIYKLLQDNGFNSSNVLNIELQSFHCKKARNYVTTVPEWVDAIAHARIVITNSFHAVAFSLIYGRPFIYIKFTGKHTRGNNRVESLLYDTNEDFRMTNITENMDLTPFRTPPNFEKNLATFREKGLTYLKQAL